MKPIYKTQITDKLHKVITEAERDNKKFEYIELTSAEFDELIEVCRPWLNWGKAGQHFSNDAIRLSIGYGRRMGRFEGVLVVEEAA